MAEPSIKLYDLAGADPDLRFSPPCWRIKMTLAHKGIPFETVPWRFTDKDVIAFSGQGRVPVLVCGGREVHESWDIARYLDETYPDKPVMGDAAARAAARFVKAWVETVVQPVIRPLVLEDIYDCIHEKDKDYFLESRTKAMGGPIEQWCPDRLAARAAVDAALKPLAETLSDVTYLGGNEPNFSDYIVFSVLQWARVVMREPVVPTEGDGPIAAWFGHLLEAHGGFAAQSPTVRGK
ncbi:MAG: glutathione S-transferase N-terminal domain-containing protein [Rhodospirillales bacterium]